MPLANASLPEAVLSLRGTILAIGDIMLDIFTYGACTRISPEAPVPVLHVTREERMLGGVGNVARNIASLGGTAVLLAPIGDDGDARTLEELAAAEPRIRRLLLRSPGRATTVKQRLVADAQQMLRVDTEQPAPLCAGEEDAIVERALAALPGVDAVILSDYGKGAVSPGLIGRLIAAASSTGKPILVDPKSRDMGRYHGATCITPNARELAEATRLPVGTKEEVATAARALLTATDASHVLVTRSEKGLCLVSRDGGMLPVPARRRAVFDVSGAGDTVIAALALAVAAGADWPVAAMLANHAAGIVVGKPGTATCSRQELEVEVTGDALGLDGKLVAASRAAKLSSQWRADGLRVGFTNGCFDLLHPGHIALLRGARGACDRLIVGLNSDSSVGRLKGPSRPLQSQASRAAVLAALAAVDLVVIFAEDTPLALIEAIRPAVLLKGADYTVETVVGAGLVQGYGGEVRLVDLVAGQSTTGIIARIG